jgi:SH3-like domain-containing protein
LIVINFPGGAPNDLCSVMSADGDAVNIRSGPGMNYNVIGLLITPAQLVSGVTDWLQIALPNGGTGWVASSVTSIVGMCGDGEGLGPGPADAICHFYPYGVNGNQIDLAAFPTGAPVLIVPDQEFVVTAQAGNWVRLRINSGLEGWILSARGMLMGNCQGLPTEAIPTYSSNVCIITMTQATDVYAQPNFSTPTMTIRNEVVVQATARTVDGWFGFDPGLDTTGQGLARLNWLPAGTQGGSHMLTSEACDYLPVVSYP